MVAIESAWPHDFPLRRNLLLLAKTGSVSYGTQIDGSSDADYMGVVVPPIRSTVGLRMFDHWTHKNDDLDVTIYSLRKFTGLLLKGNPNVIGLLFHPPQHVVLSDVGWSLWLAERSIFMSRRVLDSFSGYAYAQLMKLGHPNSRGYMGAERKQLFKTLGYDCKNAAHCIRLLRMGIELAKDGSMNVDRSGIDADEIKAIRRGEWSLGEIQREASRSFSIFDALHKSSTLPESPEEDVAEDLMLSTMYNFWGVV